MASSINIGGTYKQISKVFCNINGTWKQVTKAHCNVNGTWREWHSGSENKLYRYKSNFANENCELILTDLNTLADLSTTKIPFPVTPDAGGNTSQTGNILAANSSKIFRIATKPNSSTGALGILQELDPDTYAVLRTTSFGDGIKNTKINYYINNIDAIDNDIIISGFRSYETSNGSTNYVAYIWRIDATTMAYIGQYQFNGQQYPIKDQGAAVLFGNTIYLYSHLVDNTIILNTVDINSNVENLYMGTYKGTISWLSDSHGWTNLRAVAATSIYTYMMVGTVNAGTYLLKLNGNTLISQRFIGTTNMNYIPCNLFALKEG